MDNASQSLAVGGSGDPLVRLFKAACTSGKEQSAEDNYSPSRHLYITSEQQWSTFVDSLEAEGLVTEPSEHQELQKLWSRAVVSSNAFGRSERPCLSLQDVLRCVDDMFADEHSMDVDRKIQHGWDSVLQLDALLEAWDIHSFNSTQARQALLILHRLEESHRRGVDDLDKMCDRQRRAFITESVRRSMSSSDGRPQDGQSPCNPLLWQINNAGSVDRKVAKARVTIIRYSVKQNASTRKSGSQGFGGVEDDPWGVSQGLSGSQGIHCRRGSSSRQEENISVTVVVMPKMDLGYRARDKLWTCYLAHRQLAAGSCVMHSLGFSDRDPRETLFYYEHVTARPAVAMLSRRRLREEDVLFRYWARCALICLAQISEQSTFCLVRQISISNIMIAEQGTLVRLGGLLWGSEMRGAGKAIEECLQTREAELCLSYAGVLEDLLGIGQAGPGLHDIPPSRPSVMLANILACLRLPPMEREEVCLKGLLGHRYFAPPHSEDMDNRLAIAWKAFIDQQSDVQ